MVAIFINLFLKAKTRNTQKKACSRTFVCTPPKSQFPFNKRRIKATNKGKKLLLDPEYQIENLFCLRSPFLWKFLSVENQYPYPWSKLNVQTCLFGVRWNWFLMLIDIYRTFEKNLTICTILEMKSFIFCLYSPLQATMFQPCFNKHFVAPIFLHQRYFHYKGIFIHERTFEF